MSQLQPPIERYLSLPVTGLKVCVRIWNAQPPSSATATSAPASTSAVSSVDAIDVPVPRACDTHLVLLHGWLDNSASWDRLVPILIQQYEKSALYSRKTALAQNGSKSKLVCYCIELSGHGNSDHRSIAGTYHPTEHAVDMVQAVRLLGVHQHEFFLCGHSLGGAIAYLMSTAYGNRLAGLVLMDSIGPWASPTWMSKLKDPSILRLATALQDHLLTHRKRLPKLRATKDEILARYVKTNPFMEEESARLIAERAIKEVFQNKKTQQQLDVTSLSREEEAAMTKDGDWKRGFVFKYDNRLLASALLTPQEENTLSAFRSVTCPVLIFLATNVLRKKVYSTTGRDPRIATHWMLPESNPLFPRVLENRIAAFPNEVTLNYIEGDHHIHMDMQPQDLGAQSASIGPAVQIAEEFVVWMDRAAQIQEKAPYEPIPQIASPVFFLKQRAKL